MVNLLTKTMPWVVASLLVATSGFGQQDKGTADRDRSSRSQSKSCCEPVRCEKVCPPVCPIQLIPAYNHPARTETRCPWDVDVFASFIYWEPLEENLELGIVNTTTETALGSTAGVQGRVVETDFKFKPGFKVGLGFAFDYDDWDVQSQYTWFHSSHHAHTSAKTGGANVMPMWGIIADQSIEVYNTAKSQWHLKMDLVDLNVGRWYYVGTKLTFRPFVGARAGWIRQKMHVNYANTGAGGIGGTIGTADIVQSSTNWGLGTEAGLCTNWMMGEGFRLFSDGMVDLLFTRYNRASIHQNLVGVGGVTSPYNDNVSERKVNTLRTHVGMDLGLGWGTFLDCNNWYLDFAASYGFQVFFDQNMFRHFNSTSAWASSRNPNGNLYVHGLDVTVRLDF